MEVSSMASVVSIVLVGIVTLLAWKLGNWLWFGPKRLERLLRQQGLSGNPYRFLYGDVKDDAAVMKQVISKPFDGFSDDVASRVVPFVLQLIRTYGKNSFMWMGPTPTVYITNPEHVKDVFMKIRDFEKVSLRAGKLLAPGLASYEGDKWAKHRRIITPAFHQEKLKLMLPQMYESCNTMIKNWNKLIMSDEEKEIDVWPHLQSLTADVISRSAFGSSYREGMLIFDGLKELTKYLMQILRSVYIPGSRFLPTETNKRVKKVDNEIKDSLENIIKKREKAMERGEAMENDLLSLLMESNSKEIAEKKIGLSINEVMDECRLFYFAGQESSSVLLVWTMVLLSKYPSWQTRARDEVLQVFGKAKPDFEGLGHLKVVSMVFNEVLRLYPPGPMLYRTVEKETRVGNLVLPAGVRITLPVILIHQDREMWGDDASEFKPERFSGGISKAVKHQGAFLPFGFGPRICIGQTFALTEAKMALALILQNFTFELSPSYVHAPYSVVTLRPQHGAPLILRKL